MEGSSYPTDNVLMITEVGFAVLTTIDLVAIQVDVVC